MFQVYFLCRSCLKQVLKEAKAGNNSCPNCAKEITLGHKCDLPKPWYIETSFVFGTYNDHLKKLIALYKFRKQRHWSKLFARLLKTVQLPVGVDCILPIPLSSASLQERQFCPVSEMASYFSKMTGVPILKGLKKTSSAGTFQHFLAREERINRKNPFRLKKSAHKAFLNTQSLLILDDIMTTGSTLARVAALVHKRYPHIKIHSLCLARTQTKRKKSLPAFKVNENYKPRGDQPKVIESISRGLVENNHHQTIIGATGTGKTYVMAKIIENTGRPALVISHNKTLAAQLYKEFTHFFPDNAVEYFVSYYDYYQPEAYVAKRDLYIEKDASINDQIDKLRLRATTALMERRDVIIVASVSCIYGLGSPEDYRQLNIHLEKGETVDRRFLIRKLIDIQYERNDDVLQRGHFRVRGDVIDVVPAYLDYGIRVELFGDEIEGVFEIDPINNKIIRERAEAWIYPAKHFVMPHSRVEAACQVIQDELDERVEFYEKQNKLLEKERISTRTRYDLEMLQTLGYCSGIENYSRPLTGRKEGEPPSTLIDYFPEDFVCFIDESHVSLPQIRGMYNGDRARKMSLVDYGFRLPSALDNRPLYQEEFLKKARNYIHVSATPGDFELGLSTHSDELINRPTGLIDPEIEVRPTEGQIDDLLLEIKKSVSDGFRVLVTTLTKKMSEDLTQYLEDKQIKVNYLHSDIDAMERVEILKSLREGTIDVLVGINLLREGLDLPEVALVAILDADKIGFLRSATALIQTVGRAARNSNGRVIMYADRMSDAMKQCIDETDRRRIIQTNYNKEHGIVPTTIVKAIDSILPRFEDDRKAAKRELANADKPVARMNKKELNEYLKKLDFEMKLAADNLEFERAIQLRNDIQSIQQGQKL